VFAVQFALFSAYLCEILFLFFYSYITSACKTADMLCFLKIFQLVSVMAISHQLVESFWYHTFVFT